MSGIVFAPCEIDHNWLNSEGFYLQGSCADGSFLFGDYKSDADFIYPLNKKIEKFFQIKAIHSNPNSPAHVKIKGVAIADSSSCNFLRYSDEQEAELNIKKLRQELSTNIKQILTPFSSYLLVKCEKSDLSCFTVQFYNSVFQLCSSHLERTMITFHNFERCPNIKTGVKQLLKEISGNFFVSQFRWNNFILELEEISKGIPTKELYLTDYNISIVDRFNKLCKEIWISLLNISGGKQIQKGDTKDFNNILLKVPEVFDVKSKLQIIDIFSCIIKVMSQTPVVKSIQLTSALICDKILDKIQAFKKDELKCVIQQVWEEKKSRLLKLYKLQIMQDLKIQIMCFSKEKFQILIVNTLKENPFDLKTAAKNIEKELSIRFMDDIKKCIKKNKTSIWLNCLRLIIKEIIIESKKRIQINWCFAKSNQPTNTADHVIVDIGRGLLIFIKDLMSEFNAKEIRSCVVRLFTDAATKTLIDTFLQCFAATALQDSGNDFNTTVDTFLILQKKLELFLKNIIDKYCFQTKKNIQTQLNGYYFLIFNKKKICKRYITNYINMIKICIFKEAEKMENIVYQRIEKLVNQIQEKVTSNENIAKSIEGIIDQHLIVRKNSPLCCFDISATCQKYSEINASFPNENKTIFIKKKSKKIIKAINIESELYEFLLSMVDMSIPRGHSLDYSYGDILTKTQDIFFDLMTIIVVCGMPQIIQIIKNKKVIFDREELVIVNFSDADIKDIDDFKPAIKFSKDDCYFQNCLLENCLQIITNNSEHRIISLWPYFQQSESDYTVFNFKTTFSIIEKRFEDVLKYLNEKSSLFEQLIAKPQFQALTNLLAKNDFMKLLLFRLYSDHTKQNKELITYKTEEIRGRINIKNEKIGVNNLKSMNSSIIKISERITSIIATVRYSLDRIDIMMSKLEPIDNNGGDDITTERCFYDIVKLGREYEILTKMNTILNGRAVVNLIKRYCKTVDSFILKLRNDQNFLNEMDKKINELLEVIINCNDYKCDEDLNINRCCETWKQSYIKDSDDEGRDNFDSADYHNKIDHLAKKNDCDSIDNTDYYTNKDNDINDTSLEGMFRVLYKNLKKLLSDYEESITTKHQQFIHKLEIVPCISFPGWPEKAREWGLRQRYWPNFNVVQKILISVYHIVFKSCEINTLFDGRFSFSTAERILCGSMAESQLKVYNYLKENYKNEALTSYFIKTCCFWIFQETPSDCENAQVYLENIIAKLKDALCQGMLQHFFIPEHNLLQNFTTRKLRECLHYVEQKETIFINSIKTINFHLHSRHQNQVDNTNIEAFLLFSNQTLKTSICPIFEKICFMNTFTNKEIIIKKNK